MGDRARIQFKYQGQVSPAIYLHWNGSDVGQLLQQTKERMEGRGWDLEYTVARFVGVCHERIKGNLSLGLSNQTTELTAADSHGDAGCFVVSVDNMDVWHVECLGGYGCNGESFDGLEIGRAI